ncbi:YopX family protein, partial [Paenibacillus odorifer]
MGREIKYKAWLPTIKKMTYGHTLEQWLLDFPHLEDFSEDTVWLQYTGLKDKNGREIYEGDFIQNENTIGEIEWVQEHCAFMAFTRNPSFYRYLESDGQLNLTEIIG